VILAVFILFLIGCKQVDVVPVEAETSTPETTSTIELVETEEIPEVVVTPPTVSPSVNIPDYLIPSPEPEEGQEVIWYADLTHTGIENKIVVKLNVIREEGLIIYLIFIYDENDELIFSDGMETWHAAFGNYQLYTDTDGKQYIMRYYHDLWSGLLWVGYEIFSFDANGNKVVFKEDQFEHMIPIDRAYWADYVCPLDEIYVFADKVNKYLDSSFVLLSTWNFILRYSTPDDMIKEHYRVPIEEIEAFNAEVKEYLEKLITWHADLTHTGTSDRIVIEINEEPDYHYIYIYSENGKLLFSDECATYHAGWRNYNLYTDEDGKEYILNWYKDLWMGEFWTSYEIFSFDVDGNKVILDTDKFNFSYSTLNQEEWDESLFPQEEYDAIEAKLNEYHKNSFLLISTVWELNYSTPDNLKE